MLRIRLRRVGARKQPSYRIVVAESSSPRDGRFVEVIGYHNPRTEPETITIKEDRALHWLSVGAQPSDAVARLFKTQGTSDRFERMKAGASIEDLVAEAQVTAAPLEEISTDYTTSELETVEQVVDEDVAEDIEVKDTDLIEGEVEAAE